MALLAAVVVAGLACLVIRGIPELRQCVGERKAERRGDILFQRGRAGEAEELWAGILKGNPGAATVRNKMAILRMNSGRFDEAAGLLAEGMEISPKAYAFHFNMGLLRHMQGRYDEALASLSEVERLCPGHGEVHYVKGLIYKEQGLADLAQEQFIKELNIDPATPAAWAQVVPNINPEPRRSWLRGHNGGRR